ncbi:MAG: hypothetical protein OER22_01660 [Gammaproteobacteria bacterium]|nr:hypothetical protein [Gammaproteobacteria bacterium]MDH3372821.1 hypothetical protein [Gammaproteobacteria bacterium]MDH3407975.1 hypothetical protein [Gammaproteobacteria bacterium]MDH3551300.1 hypothetical protein [Gammaproteobacteria bacterium]
MFEVRQMAPLMIGLLLSSAAIAEDAGPSSLEADLQPAMPVSFDALLAYSGHGTRWQITDTARPVNDAGGRTQQLVQIDFQDSSTLSRVGRLKSLSLLTVAEFGRTQVFIGVDDDGLVGLHFKAFDRRTRERHLEVLRMSYLKDDETDVGPGR